MVTLKDIAREANVSVMTVSNVVNGNLSKVSKEKAAQIQEIIRRRNYVQNASALQPCQGQFQYRGYHAAQYRQ